MYLAEYLSTNNSILFKISLFTGKILNCRESPSYEKSWIRLWICSVVTWSKLTTLWQSECCTRCTISGSVTVKESPPVWRQEAYSPWCSQSYCIWGLGGWGKGKKREGAREGRVPQPGLQPVGESKGRGGRVPLYPVQGYPTPFPSLLPLVNWQAKWKHYLPSYFVCGW